MDARRNVRRQGAWFTGCQNRIDLCSHAFGKRFSPTLGPRPVTFATEQRRMPLLAEVLKRVVRLDKIPLNSKLIDQVER